MCILRYMPAVRAVGVEHHRRVVIQARRAALEERADDHHAVLLGGRGQRFARRAGDRLGLVEAAWSSLWQGYCPGNSSCRQTMFAPAAAASAMRASAFSTFVSFARVQLICTKATVTAAWLRCRL